MRYITTTFCLLMFCFMAEAQAPLVKQWDKRFGGTGDDVFDLFKLTNDGGYILGGSSVSGGNGDKSQPSWGGFNYWIVKTDSVGNKQWDKRFGGTVSERLSSLLQTNDNGYILGGGTWSGLSGDKTQNNWGDEDYWIVKIDSIGNKQWDKRYGGLNTDDLITLDKTYDGGYILGGMTNSGIGGDRTQALWGGTDYWVVKIDSLGNKQWDKRYGGTGNETLFSLQQTVDGGYILGGDSYSGVSGDKTQASQGDFDYWIVKIDSMGAQKWDKRLGGINSDHLFSLSQTYDGGYILGGESASGISGDKTQASQGGYDYWIVKIDSIGNKEWDKTFGANDNEEFMNLSQTSDGGYLLGGSSYSNANGDKSENNMGQEQAWIIKTDSRGNMQWDKTIFTSGHDEVGFALQTGDRCYVVANYNGSDTGGYKTQPNRDITNRSVDYWIVKFCDTTICVLPPISIGVNENLLSVYGGIAYEWYLNGTIINGATTNTYIATQGGSYTVMVTDSNGCTATSSPVIISGIENVTEEDVVSVYPNPLLVDGCWLLVGNNFMGGIAEVTDADGRVVFKSEIRNPKSEISFDAAKGVYLLRITSGSSSAVRKLVRL